MLKTHKVWALLVSLLLATCIGAVSLLAQETTSDSNSQLNSNYTPKAAPVWQKIGNTGLPTQNWWIQFDKKGYMYVSSNNPPAGGVSKSTDKGAHWTVTKNGLH